MTTNNPDISLVIPLYNEEESLPELLAWIERVMAANGFSYEVIFIDDGSNDNSWNVVKWLRSRNPHVQAIRFRRNYGKSAALYCGFEAAQGEVVITMDADLQDSPDEIPELYRMITAERYDLVSGWKKRRHDPVGKTWPSKFFNFTARTASGIQLHDFNCGLKAYRKKVVKSIEVYGEMHRFIPLLAKSAGFKRIGEKVVLHQARKYGVSKFGWERMIKGYLDLITVMFMSKFSKSPMYFFGGLGSLMFLVGGATAVAQIAEKLYKQAHGLPIRNVTDQPLFFIAITAVIIGVQLFLAGFLGELIGRNSGERNRYLIDERLAVEQLPATEAEPQSEAAEAPASTASTAPEAEEETESVEEAAPQPKRKPRRKSAAETTPAQSAAASAKTTAATKKKSASQPANQARKADEPTTTTPTDATEATGLSDATETSETKDPQANLFSM